MLKLLHNNAFKDVQIYSISSSSKIAADESKYNLTATGHNLAAIAEKPTEEINEAALLLSPPFNVTFDSE